MKSGKMVGVALALLIGVAGSARAVEQRWREGTARGSLVLTDPKTGKVLAEGHHTQRVSGDRLYVTTAFDFRDGRHLEEKAEFRQGQELSQEKWRWEERVNGAISRQFLIDFTTGQAHGLNVEGGQRKETSGKVEVKPGSTFAGLGFVFALKNLSERLEKGETVNLTAIVFAPGPRAVTVKLLGQGQENLQVAGRTLAASHFIIRPHIPWVAKPFIHVPDDHLWFSRTPSPTFLRSEAPLMDLTDPVVRTDAQEPPGHVPAAARRAPPQ